MFDDPDAREFLKDLLRGDYIENEAARGVAALVADEGDDNLSPDQRAVFQRHVVDVFVTEACERDGDTIPWSEMLDAYHNGGYCGYCYHMGSKEGIL